MLLAGVSLVQKADLRRPLLGAPLHQAAFVSLASAIETLNGKLHYTHRMTSLHETVSKLEAAATEHANELHAAEAAHSKALDDFRAKAADKMERERARRKDKEAERDREWRGKEKSWEAKLALAEQRVREEVAEKKKLRECVPPVLPFALRSAAGVADQFSALALTAMRRRSTRPLTRASTRSTCSSRRWVAVSSAPRDMASSLTPYPSPSACRTQS